MSRRFSLVLASALVLAFAASSAGAGGSPPGALTLTHGIASGDVTDTGAIVWARASGKGKVYVEWADNPALAGAKTRGLNALAYAATDFTAQLKITYLEPDTRYWYRMWVEGQSPADGLVGTFKTAPARTQARPVSLILGGDVGGQNYCRTLSTGGYHIFAAMEALQPDFLLANGDMIYADGVCPANGPNGPQIPGTFPSISAASVDWTNTPQVREVYNEHWRYNRADPHTQSFFASVPMVAQWDDHEVINDFGALWTFHTQMSRAGFPNIVREGRDAFFNYSPIRRDKTEPNRIYRSFRYGKHVEMFVLDGRSYRDRNNLVDSPTKVVLGDAQVQWLLDGVTSSDATWKIVASDIPIAAPTGSGNARDSWGRIGSEQTGAHFELLKILSALDAADVENLVVLATDVHYAVNTVYSKDFDGDGDLFEFHEFLAGPLSATSVNPPQFDPIANPTRLYAQANFFNFGYARIQPGADGATHFVYDVRNEFGVPQPGSAVDLAPR